MDVREFKHVSVINKRYVVLIVCFFSLFSQGFAAYKFFKDFLTVLTSAVEDSLFRIIYTLTNMGTLFSGSFVANILKLTLTSITSFLCIITPIKLVINLFSSVKNIGGAFSQSNIAKARSIATLLEKLNATHFCILKLGFFCCISNTNPFTNATVFASSIIALLSHLVIRLFIFVFGKCSVFDFIQQTIFCVAIAFVGKQLIELDIQSIAFSAPTSFLYVFTQQIFNLDLLSLGISNILSIVFSGFWLILWILIIVKFIKLIKLMLETPHLSNTWVSSKVFNYVKDLVVIISIVLILSALGLVLDIDTFSDPLKLISILSTQKEYIAILFACVCAILAKSIHKNNSQNDIVAPPSSGASKNKTSDVDVAPQEMLETFSKVNITDKV